MKASLNIFDFLTFNDILTIKQNLVVHLPIDIHRKQARLSDDQGCPAILYLNLLNMRGPEEELSCLKIFPPLAAAAGCTTALSMLSPQSLVMRTSTSTPASISKLT